MKRELAQRNDSLVARRSDEGLRVGLRLDDGLENREPGFAAALKELGEFERVVRVGCIG